MAWVKFISDFDWKPKPMVTIAYRAGMVLNVPMPALIAAGERVIRMRKPHRHADPVEVASDDS